MSGRERERRGNYAAAEIARSKRDVALIGDLVACLDRLPRPGNLNGVLGPAKWAGDWIEKGQGKLAGAGS